LQLAFALDSASLTSPAFPENNSFQPKQQFSGAFAGEAFAGAGLGRSLGRSLAVTQAKPDKNTGQSHYGN